MQEEKFKILVCPSTDNNTKFSFSGVWKELLISADIRENVWKFVPCLLTAGRNAGAGLCCTDDPVFK